MLECSIQVVTKKSGEPGNYITIRGSSYRAVLKGEEDGSSHIFDLQHSYYHLDRFTIDGYQGDEVYADKCLYVQTNRDRDEAYKEIEFNGHRWVHL